MRAALGVLAIAVATGAGLLVVSTPSSDAPVPAWMSSRVEAGRASILEHIDLVEPGSPLVLISYHCRDDGAVRLVYRSRYLWLSERRYFADAPAGWSSGPMGGGTLSSGEDPRAQDDWLAERQEVDCSVPPATEFAHRCDGRTYSIGYPEGWFVHPGDPAADVAPCSYFAARPFDATREDDFGVAGAQVALWAGIGSAGASAGCSPQLR